MWRGGGCVVPGVLTLFLNGSCDTRGPPIGYTSATPPAAPASATGIPNVGNNEKLCFPISLNI